MPVYRVNRAYAANVEIRPAPTTNDEWEKYFCVLESEEEEEEEERS